MANNIFSALQEQLPVEAFEALLNPDPTMCFAIRHYRKGYLTANENFVRLMAVKNQRELIYKKNEDIYSDKNLLNIYRKDDETVLDTQQPLEIEALIKPDSANFEKILKGHAYPLCSKTNQIDSIVFINHPLNQIIYLDLRTLVSTKLSLLKKYLIQKSYPVKTQLLNFNITRMELLCFAELLKGKHAGEIAESLEIKQLTVESYLSNLRNKCGVGNKSELIQFFIDNPVLENIII